MAGQGEGDICGEGDGMAEAVAAGGGVLVLTGGGVAVVVIELVGKGVVTDVQAASSRANRMSIKRGFMVSLLESEQLN
jgi:hypothetical protein